MWHTALLENLCASMHIYVCVCVCVFACVHAHACMHAYADMNAFILFIRLLICIILC